MQPCIILLGGANGAGKDTYAQAFASLMPKSTIASVAQPIKNEYARNQGFPVSRFDDRVFKESVRSELIALGDLRRQQDKYHWIRQVSVPENQSVIISDFRFYCEYEYLRSNYMDRKVLPILIQRDACHVNHTDIPDALFAYKIQNRAISEHREQAWKVLDESGVLPPRRLAASCESGAE